MYYITTRQKVKEQQISWLDLLNDEDPLTDYAQPTGSAGTVTRCVDKIKPEILAKTNVSGMIKILKEYNERHKNLYETDKRKLYRHFTIPKRSGGLRPIDAPCDELQNALAELKDILEQKFGLLYHTANFAYVKERSTVQEVRKHQVKNSNWFLKTDFSGFFPSTTINFVMKMLGMIYPTSEICKDPEGRVELMKALSLGFLNGGLPQGTKLSPYLTCVMMIPIDHKIFGELTKRRYVYTRYADDIHISCVQKFDPEKMKNYLRKILKEFGAPYILKDEKTTFGRKNGSGSNWMLGVNLNQDNNMTVGWRAKKTFKAMTTNLIMDYKHGKYWAIDDVQHYNGLLSYYKMVEPDYFKDLIKHFNDKFNVNVAQITKRLLSGSVQSW